jgi:hypothetical protein
MMESKTDKRLAWVFLAASLYLPLFIVFFISHSLLGAYNLDLYRKLYPVMNPLTGALLLGLFTSQVVCLICVVTACAGTQFKTLKRPQWWIGGVMLVVLWSVVAAAILILPHPPPD